MLQGTRLLSEQSTKDGTACQDLLVMKFIGFRNLDGRLDGRHGKGLARKRYLCLDVLCCARCDYGAVQLLSRRTAVTAKCALVGVVVSTTAQGAPVVVVVSITAQGAPFGVVSTHSCYCTGRGLIHTRSLHTVQLSTAWTCCSDLRVGRVHGSTTLPRSYATLIKLTQHGGRPSMFPTS